MCSHSFNIQEAIKHLLRQLYPKVKEQFNLIDSCYVLSITNSIKERKAIISLLNDMQTEFSSLHTYESRLVFPSILNMIDSSKIELQNYHPNITDLIYLTEKKEHKLNQLTIELATELKKRDFEDVEHHVEKLINILQNEFVESKQNWNALIHDCLNNCSNLKFNKLSEINP